MEGTIAPRCHKGLREFLREFSVLGGYSFVLFYFSTLMLREKVGTCLLFAFSWKRVNIDDVIDLELFLNTNKQLLTFFAHYQISLPSGLHSSP